MVGPTLTRLAGRIPTIRFRKGGLASGHAAPAAQQTVAAQAAAPAQGQQAAPISTSGPLNDVNLPARYRRLPLSQDEIDHINGGGIKDDKREAVRVQEKSPSVAVAIITLPQDVLTKEQVKLNLVVHKVDKKNWKQ